MNEYTRAFPEDFRQDFDANLGPLRDIDGVRLRILYFRATEYIQRGCDEYAFASYRQAGLLAPRNPRIASGICDILSSLGRRRETLPCVALVQNYGKEGVLGQWTWRLLSEFSEEEQAKALDRAKRDPLSIYKSP